MKYKWNDVEGDGMTIRKSQQKEINFFDSNTNFSSSIPIKVYDLDGVISGDSYHTHDYMQIWYVYRGSCDHYIGGKKHTMVKGDLFVLPPYIVHKVISMTKSNFRIIGCEFSASFFNEKNRDFTNTKEFIDFAYIEPFLLSEEKVQPKLHISEEMQPKVEGIMLGLLEENCEQKKYYDLFLRAQVLQLLALIAREYNHTTAKHKKEDPVYQYRKNMIKAIEYVHQHYDEELRLDDICQYALMSKSYFCYLFKSLTGKTFTEYVTDLRIQKALELVAITDRTITQIGYDVGFRDTAHFCRTFKKIIGVSPTDYRKKQ